MTTNVATVQFYAFCAFVLFGVVVGAVYFVAEGVTRHSVLATVVFDAFFGVITAFCAWKLNLAVNSGSANFYVALGVLTGACCCHTILSPTLDKLSQALYNLFIFNKGEQNGKIPARQKKGSDACCGSTSDCGAGADFACDVVANNNVKQKSRTTEQNVGRLQQPKNQP